MGNNASAAAADASSGTSNQASTKALRAQLNLIATRFILSSDFQSLKRLVDEKYCDDLSIITRDLLSSRFTSTQIKNLAKSDTVFYISKRELASIESSTKDKKNRTCKRIARFYVRIAHLFASIITTVYPRWSDADGTAQAFDGADFCKQRIDALARSVSVKPNGSGSGSGSGSDAEVSVQPTVCSLYSTSSSVYAAPGFSALELLYNDEYDEASGTFNRRSGAMQAKYDSDLVSLYAAFTGNTNKPPEIKSFSDINIVALSKRFSECGPKVSSVRVDKEREAVGGEMQTGGQEYRSAPPGGTGADSSAAAYMTASTADSPAEAATKELARIKKDAEAKEQAIKDDAINMSGALTYPTGVKKTGSFSNYAAHVKTMIANAEKSKAVLLGVVDKLFLIVKTEGGSNQAKITIHPALTSELLDQLVNQTRDVILQMYLGCERDFYTGIKLLRVMIEEKMQEKMEASLLRLRAETKMAIKDVTKRQFLKKETDVAKMQGDARDIQSFKNPLYDEELQRIREKKGSDKYNSILDLEYEIKNLETALLAKKKNIDMLKIKKTSYENQKNIMNSSGSAGTKFTELSAQIDAINTELNTEAITKTEIDTSIRTKQDEMAKLRLAQIS
jgi:hypothetical protein